MTKIKCEAGQFKKFIQAVKTMNQESRLHVDADGLSLICVDTANVGMVKLSLPESEIKDYQFDKKKPSTQLVALEWSKVSRSLNAAKPQTPLTLEFKEQHLHYSYDEIEGEIMYLDPNTVRKEPNPPNIVLNTEVDFDGSLLTKIGRIMTSDKITLIVKDGLATISFDEGEHKGTIILSRTGKGEARSLYHGITSKTSQRLLTGRMSRHPSRTITPSGSMQKFRESTLTTSLHQGSNQGEENP